MAAALPDDFFQLVERASDLILIVREGRIAYANPAFAATLGYPRESLAGMAAVELAHPDERESVRDRIRDTLAGAPGHGSRRRRLLCRDGSEVIIESSTFPIEFGGQPAAVLVGRDLTARELAEKERRRSETDFRNLVQSLPGGVMVHVAGRILFANDLLAGIVGARAEDLVGRSPLDFVPASQQEEIRALMERNASSGAPAQPREIPIRRPDGGIRIVETSGIPVRFGDHDARLVYLNDVTESRATERHLRALIESSPLAVYSVNTDARVLSWNHAAERIFGWDPAGPESAPRTLGPDSSQRVRELCAAAERDGIAEMERDLVRPKDGRPMTVRSSAAPLRGPDGKVEGFVFTTADVTEARRATDSLRAAAEEWQDTFDAVDAPVLLLEGPSREIMRINRAALEVIGLPAISLSLATRAEPWIAAGRVADAAERSGAPALDQVRDGGKVWLVSASPLRQGRVILMLRDVSQLSQLQDALRHTEAMSAMGALVAGVAHEVRNPLFGMSATLDAMEQVFGSDQQQEPFLRAMRRELDRISALMRDLLEYGRPPAVQLVMDALAPVVALAARSCLPAAELVSVHIDNHVGPEAGAVAMDAGRLAQVFQNLIENAVQHSPPGGRVQVVSRREPGRVRVSVLDSGAGFRPDDLPRIFDPFFSRRRGGTGLGLSIVQRIVEQHRGSIEAVNRPEGGASVSVLLPLP